jgi:hypothetical protein
VGCNLLAIIWHSIHACMTMLSIRIFNLTETSVTSKETPISFRSLRTDDDSRVRMVVPPSLLMPWRDPSQSDS